ncbi:MULTISPECIES: hypothetical protein [Butyrivibrio]|uniref:hypothetical protein n=1 Tax=Butyrivibrio TaxID=830 RepID=UPI00042157EA|nr:MULTISPECIES: hypothetical protein [Butyrivibrio]
MRKSLIVMVMCLVVASGCMGCGSEKELSVNDVEINPIVEDKPVVVDENGKAIKSDKIADDLETVFEKFEGSWIFDSRRGAAVMIERANETDYVLPGASWVVAISGGDIMTDKDVVDYTQSTISFCKKNSDGDYYYKLSFGDDVKSIEMACGDTQNAADSVLICNEKSEG